MTSKYEQIEDELSFSRCDAHGTRLIGTRDRCHCCQAIMSERRRILTLLNMDLLLKDKSTSEAWLSRANQLIRGEEK